MHAPNILSTSGYVFEAEGYQEGESGPTRGNLIYHLPCLRTIVVVNAMNESKVVLAHWTSVKAPPMVLKKPARTDNRVVSKRPCPHHRGP